jgi:uncharacterized protein with PIN domain
MCAQGDSDPKERWLEEGKAAYERYFTPKNLSKDDETFNDLEEAAVAEGRELTRRLIGEKLSEKFAREDPAQADCPWCGRHCERSSHEAEERTVQTRAGPVTFRRLGFFCPSCRKVFFPSGL